MSGHVGAYIFNSNIFKATPDIFTESENRTVEVGLIPLYLYENNIS